MRHLADILLARRQPGGFAHRPAEPGAGLGGGGPDAFHQPAQHGDIHALQGRLLHAPDRDARMPVLGARAAHHGAGEQFIQQIREIVRGHVRQVFQCGERVRAAIRRALSPASPDHSRAAPVCSVRGGDVFGGFQQGAQGHRRVDGERQVERAEQKLETVEKFQLRACALVFRQPESEARETGRWTRAAQGVASPACAHVPGNDPAAGRRR